MNMHSGGQVPPVQHYGGPPPGAPGAPPGHPHHNPYPGEPVYPPPPPGVHIVHHPHHPGPHGHPSHPHHMGDESMDGGMEHEDSDPNVGDDSVMGMGGAMVGVMGHPGDGGLMEPPKRKRRRQALSCTECKRRKIKCDRINPCGPCVRRGEQDKCQWHVIEPLEKFVTRAEWDDLRRKFDILERTVAQITGRPPGTLFGPPPPGMAPPPWGMPPPGHMGGPPGDPDSGGSGPRSPSLMVDPNLQVEPDNRRHDPNMGSAGAGGGGGPPQPPTQQMTSNSPTEGGSKKRGAQTQIRGEEEAERLRRQMQLPQGISSSSKVKPSSSNKSDLLRGVNVGNNISNIRTNSNNNLSSNIGNPFPASTHTMPHPQMYPMIMPMDVMSSSEEIEEMVNPPQPMGSMVPAPIRLLPILPPLHPDNWAQLGGGASPGMVLGLSAVPVPLVDFHHFDAPMKRVKPVRGLRGPMIGGHPPPPPPPPMIQMGEVKTSPTLSNVYSILNDEEEEEERAHVGVTSAFSPVGGSGKTRESILMIQGAEGVKKRKSNTTQVRPRASQAPSQRQDHPVPTILEPSIPPKTSPFLLCRSLPAAYWIQGLPPRSICDAVVDFYFRHVAWNHGIILESSFRAALDAFWDNERAPQENLPGTAFVALYFMIMYHGVSSMDPCAAENCKVLQDVQEWRRLCHLFWHGAQFAMSQMDLTISQDPETIQALVLLALVYLSLESMAWEAFSPTLAFTIRIAQNMGYAQLGEEGEGQAGPAGAQLRELKRRLWWSLVILDWQYAVGSYSPCMIHPGQFNTAIPSNVDLAEIKDGSVFNSKSDTLPTDASFLRAKCKLAELVGNLRVSSTSPVPNVNAGLQNALCCDRQYSDYLTQLPSSSFLTRRNEGVEISYPYIKCQRLMFTIGTFSGVIALHRTRFLSEYHNPDFAEGVRSTVVAAERVLAALHEFDQSTLPGRRWWGILLHAYRAAVILLADHQRKRQTAADVQLSKTRVQSINLLIGLLNGVKNVVAAAGKSSLVLQHLLDEAQKPLDGNGHTRKRSQTMEYDGLELYNPMPTTGQKKHSDTSELERATGGRKKSIWEYILDLELELELTEDQSENKDYEHHG